MEAKGEISVKPELYLAIRDFNPKDLEPAITNHKIKPLSFRVGEILIVTLTLNEQGWFEGYRHNDPDRICGVSHKSMIRKILF